MEFEVDIQTKFDSTNKGKSLASNRTNKFNYGKKQSSKNFLGESDYTIGKKISPRLFIPNSGKFDLDEEINKENSKKIQESSEEDGEDLIIGDSMALGLDLEANEKLPSKVDEKEDELEAIESLSKEINRKPRKNDNLKNYLTLKTISNLNSKLTRNLSDKKIQHEKKKGVSVSKWKGRSKTKRKKRNHSKLDTTRHYKKSKSRSSSRVKLYKMTSERNSQMNSARRKSTKTKFSGKKSDRKQQISRLLEKYSKEDNQIEPKDPGPLDQVHPVAFSSTFGTNLHDKIKDAKKKQPKPQKPDQAQILEKCKAFKHDTQSNLFEVETLNTLTRAEDDYVAKPEYLNLNQPYLDAKVRTVLMGWMGEVSEDLWFCRDTFHMACNYVDRFLQVVPKIPKDQLQLIGLTCLYIASKMEEVQMRNVNDYLSSACNIYTEQQMMNCEIQIITKLDFKLNPPTLNLWANWYMNQWDNFIISDNFVQEHPMIRDSQIVAQFKQGNEESYNLYREFMQYLGNTINSISSYQTSFSCFYI